jgi:beta-lactamase superfamily II metal-dependent hydrolase
MREFAELIEQHKELTIMRLHTGQHFYVRNLEFEVLATHEDIYPQGLAYFNDSSTVLMMTVDSCKILFLGDASIIESELLCNRYGDYLKADIVQVAHHGFNGATVSVYEHAAGRVALFPTSQEKYEENQGREPNKKAVELSKEIYVAGNGTAAFRLPYVLGEATVAKKEIN